MIGMISWLSSNAAQVVHLHSTALLTPFSLPIRFHSLSMLPPRTCVPAGRQASEGSGQHTVLHGCGLEGPLPGGPPPVGEGPADGDGHPGAGHGGLHYAGHAHAGASARATHSGADGVQPQPGHQPGVLPQSHLLPEVRGGRKAPSSSQTLTGLDKTVHMHSAVN